MMANYKFKLDDFLAIWKGQKRHADNTRWRILIFASFFIVGIALVPILNNAGFGQEKLKFLFVLLAVCFVVLFLGRFIILPIILRRHFTQTDLNGACIAVEINDSYISLATRVSRAETRWSGIICAEQTASHFLLWTSKVQAYSIPLRSFTDEVQAAEFRKLVNSQVTVLSVT